MVKKCESSAERDGVGRWVEIIWPTDNANTVVKSSKDSLFLLQGARNALYGASEMAAAQRLASQLTSGCRIFLISSNLQNLHRSNWKLEVKFEKN